MKFQSPTLRVFPGDHLLVTLSNQYDSDEEIENMSQIKYYCGSNRMTSSSTNIHFHGIHGLPFCHEDEVLETIINYKETFTYNIEIPLNQPPGLYWYHPHVHGLSERAVLGGATGVIIVEGLENVKPFIHDAIEKVLVIRDQLLPSELLAQQSNSPSDVPGYDISLNYIPISFPDYITPIMMIKPSEKQLWRIANTAADTILNLVLEYDNVLQTLMVLSYDGSPVENTDYVNMSYISLSPGGRVEFLIMGPSSDVKNAILSTLRVDTGPDGDNDVARPILKLEVDNNQTSSKTQTTSLNSMDSKTINRSYDIISTSKILTISDILDSVPIVTRTLFFSEEDYTDPETNETDTRFYITKEGSKEILFQRNNPPSITAFQGTVEDWKIYNRAKENHVFHIHQIRFLILAINDIPVAYDDLQFHDVIDIPYWTGNSSDPYPSITIRLDFKSNHVIGKFVYHCHILEHEDKGMMAIINIIANPSITSAPYSQQDVISIGEIIKQCRNDRSCFYWILLYSVCNVLIISLLVISIVYMWSVCHYPWSMSPNNDKDKKEKIKNKKLVYSKLTQQDDDTISVTSSVNGLWDNDGSRPDMNQYKVSSFKNSMMSLKDQNNRYTLIPRQINEDESNDLEMFVI
jgi:FtsP/CotA-like multicopper oxidase with cupredoxin domain